MSENPFHSDSQFERDSADASGVSQNGSSPTQRSDQDMSELRRLLIGDEGRQIAGLQERMDSVVQFEEAGQREALGRELPGAISYHNKDTSKLANALGPAIEQTLSVSIRRNPKPFADAIFPAIGPAIRRAIAEALRSVIDSMNRTMEHSFSVKSMRWRLEAARTGRSFSEVMLTHTLDYRVEQLFLIDKKSGLLIQHLFAEAVDVKDSDIVSSMLNAIQDFVRDSLGAPKEDILESIEIGDLTVMIEPGPDAILAAVVRGIPNQELRTTLKEIIEAVHLQYGHMLSEFDGDSDSLVPVLPLMRAGLVQNFKRREKKQYQAWFVIGFVALLLALWLGWRFWNYNLGETYLENLKNEPGLTVTDAVWVNGQLAIKGLRDPLAEHPDSLRPASLPAKRIHGTWEPYLALDSLMIVNRASMQLQAPESVAFRYHEGILFASGEASAAWLGRATDRASMIPGILLFDASGVQVSDALETINNIEQLAISFTLGSSLIRTEMDETLDELAAHMLDINRLNLGGGTWHVLMRGFTSTEGNSTTNLNLSIARAQGVQEALISRGVPQALLSIDESIVAPPATPETTESGRAAHRVVRFEVVER